MICFPQVRVRASLLNSPEKKGLLLKTFRNSNSKFPGIKIPQFIMANVVATLQYEHCIIDILPPSDGRGCSSARPCGRCVLAQVHASLEQHRRCAADEIIYILLAR